MIQHGKSCELRVALLRSRCECRPLYRHDGPGRAGQTGLRQTVFYPVSGAACSGRAGPGCNWVIFAAGSLTTVRHRMLLVTASGPWYLQPAVTAWHVSQSLTAVKFPFSSFIRTATPTHIAGRRSTFNSTVNRDVFPRIWSRCWVTEINYPEC